LQLSAVFDLIGVYKSARAKAIEYHRKVTIRKGEASFAPSKLSVIPNHRRANVPRGVDHNGSRFRVVVLRIQANKPARAAMPTLINVVRKKRALR
jgi:hypothetical protein